MSTSNAATLLLRRPDGRILMQLRDDGHGNPIPFPNIWNFPGGKIEANELPLEAAIREIAEEFEIRLNGTDCREIWRYTHDHAAVDHIFLCQVSSEVEPILHEGAAWAWLTIEEIAELELGFEQEKIVAYFMHEFKRAEP